MKNNLNIVWIAVAFVITAAVVSACSSFDDEQTYRYSDYGTAYLLDETGSDYYLLRDDGVILDIHSNLAAYKEISDGQRVRFNYDIVDGSAQGASAERYGIKLYGIFDILTKETLTESGVREYEGMQEALGDDPLIMRKWWLAGKYLTIQYEYPHRTGSGTAHMISLVYDDIDSEGEAAVVTLRHNGYDAAPTAGSAAGFKINYAVVSFDISPMLPQDGGAITLKLVWTRYVSDGNWDERDEASETGIFDEGRLGGYYGGQPLNISAGHIFNENINAVIK